MTHERFWSKVDRKGPDECWPWTGHKHTAGYGIYWHDGKNVRANRFALLITQGPSANGEDYALHSCDNPECCNPRHLRWGSVQDNTDDRRLRTGFLHGEQSHNAILTSALVDQIYRMRLEGWTIKEIAAELDLPKTAVENVYTGRAWTHRLGVNGNPTLEELRKRRPPRTKRRAHNAIITDELADTIFHRRMDGESAAQIASSLGLPLGTVSPVFCGLAFAHRLGKDGNPTRDELRSVRAIPKSLKLSDDDIDEIRAHLARGVIGADLAAKFGVSRATISNIKNGKR